MNVSLGALQALVWDDRHSSELDAPSPCQPNATCPIMSCLCRVPETEGGDAGVSADRAALARGRGKRKQML